MSFDALTVYLITFLYLNPLRLQSLSTFISLYYICLSLTLDFYFCQYISICLGHYLSIFVELLSVCGCFYYYLFYYYPTQQAVGL